ncbi:transporter substrate-binding domain-containing protein [Castellaniella defragrans]|uniref:Polar amino acid transport system substrate-binding protein n=1 Tax=Castellaniella defragrans TaxID=75697 RepID=A0A7W9TN10_CASDE|nr:transporter substrate-binding domain-containing protein [Castellaniella defragrans]KAB0610744.1 transporter substrate-binding domain-containing protein [Castellaniella defragrans]MBB6083176.1 polar amino acid transport system substrate-binding protein [Castellaniella defragrans]
MQTLKHFSQAALCVLALACAAGAQANQLEDIQKKGEITIGVDISAPPYGMVDENAKQTGFDIDAARLLAESLGVKLVVVPVTGPTRVQFLRTKKVDAIMASFSITEERKKVIDFSDPYGVVPVVVGGPASEKIEGPRDLSGKAIAVTRGTTSDKIITDSTKDVPDVTIVRYQDDATTNTAVMTGQQKYIVAASSVLPEIKKTSPNTDIAFKYTAVSFPMGVGIRQNEPEFKARVNEWVAANLKNGKLNGIYQKYFFGQSLPEEMLK